ncbi:hypothetical protein MATL_G00098140 [Megalops atlanticus]|uniref:Uncharacterized protein n=1 Tax=Megalops atlanticus TaxID=7932 RepID=A0A9D3Q2A3_MEGAT|nr:hypothetical protein MATL_G00098140 [Megalops atlanticus]
MPVRPHFSASMASDTNAKYNSRAAQMYREKIRQLANAALSKYGTNLWIEASGNTQPATPEKKEADFFAEHTEPMSSWDVTTPTLSEQNGAITLQFEEESPRVSDNN